MQEQNYTTLKTTIDATEYKFENRDNIDTKPNWLQGWYYGRRAKFIDQYFN